MDKRLASTRSWAVWLPMVLGCYTLLGGMLALVGWFANLQRLTDWDRTGISMLPNAAVCAILSGAALMLLSRGRVRLPVVLGALVAVIGVATLLEHVTGLDLGIDRLLLWQEWGQRATVAPGRMGLPGSLCWALVGAGAALCGLGPRMRGLAANAGLAVCLLSLLSLIGYFYGAQGLYTIPSLTAIALPTATMIFAGGVALVALIPERGIGSLLSRQDLGGAMLRRTLLPAVLLSFTVGWLRDLGQGAGLHESNFGTAVRTLVEMVCFVALLAWTARSLSRAAQEISEKQTALQDQLEVSQVLQRVSTHLIQADDAGSLYERILDAAVAIMRSDYASIQMLDRERGELRLLGYRGFDAAAARFWEWVRPRSASTCGKALQTGARCIVSDVETCDFMAGTEDLDTYLQTGIRAVQTTPLTSRSGELIGMLSTHWRAPHRPPDDHLSALDTLARQAADLLERGRILSVLTESEMRLKQDSRGLARLQELSSRLWRTPTLESGLTMVLEGILEVLGTDQGTIQLLDPERRALHIVVHRGFDRDLIEAFREVSADDGSAGGRALRTGERVVIEDIENDAEFAPFRGVARAAGYRSVQSTPLIGREGPLGILSTHFSSPLPPSRQALDQVDLFARQAVDFIERKRVEEALKDSERRKDEFLAILAHELRNPLAPVRNAAHYLKLKNLPDADLRRPVEMIERQSAQMARMIDDLLDVSRVSRGLLELRLERVNLDEIVNAAVDTCHDEIQARGQSLEILVPPTPLALVADRARLIQVVCNLLANASKYSPPGGAISMEARVHGDALQLSVTDDGVGIPEEKLDEIFELFAQVDRSLERQGGLGIGLTLARQLVQLHHGTIRAKSDGIGRGSEFIVTVPIARTECVPATPSAADPPLPIRPRRILLADDNRDAVDSLKLLLRLKGHGVYSASDGEEAVALAEKVRPDVAILDIGMPKLNGYDAARRIRATDWGRSIHLVALTGWGQEDDRRRARESGFDAHLVKPVAPDHLQEFLSKLPVRTSESIPSPR